MAGNINGVQAKCKEKNSKIFYVHCHAHCLNLVLIDSIEASCIRHSILETVANQINLKLKTLKSISKTRWACRYEAVAAVKNNYTAIIIAIQTICDKTKQSEVRAKSRGLILQLKTFDFIFALNMLHPILLLIVKVNSYLQAEELNLLTSTNLIQSLKQKLYQLRSDPTFFNDIYCDTVKHCEENNVAIPKVRKRKISTKIGYSANNQYFADTKEKELRVSCFNVVLDDLLNGLNDRFNQETLNLILAVGNVLKLEPTRENLLCLESAFEVDCNDLNGEIQLLRNMPGVPLGSTTKTIFHWIEFLNQNNQKNIFLEFHKVIVLFSTIPVTSCSCCSNQ
ncbi:zinc finger MYM-type protein 1-like [Aphis gossypii]|uniref:zinc finger MYM-type protein 1-like n=1 Tax=Aphis gossypii TaxID=80765 RepID=UPI002158D852|nr:zinc finger MYM-type protein 1-like [Aphis gossypii]